MTTTGAIAANFHEGARSEYLAHYVFSAFGTSVPTPRPEDYGIDLFCTLGHRIGQRLHVDSYYFVQVKSIEDDVVFEETKSVEWLLSLISPLLIAYVNKGTGNIRVFATIGIAMLYAKQDLRKIRLVPEPYPEEFRQARHGNPMPCAEFKDETADIYMGNPILDFNITALQNDTFVEKTKSIIRSWLQIDQANIAHKSMGYTFFQMPDSHSVNEPAPAVCHVVGNFLDSENTAAISARHLEALFKALSQQLNIAANEVNQARWKAIYGAALETVQQYPDMRSGPAFFSLVTSVCFGAKRLDLSIDEVFSEHFG